MEDRSSEAIADLEALTGFWLLDLSTRGLHTTLCADENGVEHSEDDQLDDLLACLGEEEQKVEKLKRKLLELGFDPEPLLASDPQIDSEDDIT